MLNKMNKRLLKTLGLVALFQLGFVSTSHAAIYKCVNTQDEVFYLDKPCPVNHDEKSLKHVKDPKNTGQSTGSDSSAQSQGSDEQLGQGAEQTGSVSATKDVAPFVGGAEKSDASKNKAIVNNAPAEVFFRGNLPANIGSIETLDSETAEARSQLNAY